VTFEMDGEIDGVPSGRENLAARAADELLVRAGRSGHGVQVSLRKKIPAGGGLGGGSADAAATLVAIRRLIEVDIDDADLRDVGATVGSDVPFCLQGGAAWMRGRGEILEPVDLPVGIAFLVVLPPFRLATSAVYAAWDELGGPHSERLVPAPAVIAGVVAELGNDLEAAAVVVEPRLADFRAALEEAAGAPAIMAGSGSAYVVPVVDDDRNVAGYARRVSRRLHLPVTPAATVSRGVRLGSG
jgi:4-diphosphocytidyl-2-C-methyl-D-erythritol kinase